MPDEAGGTRLQVGHQHRPHRLRWRMVALTATMLLITLAGIGAGVYIFSWRAENGQWQARQEDAAFHGSRTVAAFVQRIQTPLHLVTTMAGAGVSSEDVLEHILAEDPALIELVLLSPTGQVLAAAQRGEPALAGLATIPQSDWFRQAQPGLLYLSGVQLSAGQDPCLIVSMRAAGGNVMAARVSLSVAQQVVRDVAVGRTGRAYVVNSEGEILAHSNPDRVPPGTSIKGRQEAAALTAPGGVWRGSYTSLQGESVSGVAAPVEYGAQGSRLHIITEVSRTELHSASRTVLQLFGSGFLLFGIVMMILTAVAMERVVIRPVEALRSGAEQIGRGELGQQVAVASQDEIGDVAVSFNRMAGELRTLYGSLEQQVAERTHDLERRSAYLRTASDVSRITSSILEVDRLVLQTVYLIVDRFGLYHASLYQVDDTGQWAVYRAGAGPGGQSAPRGEERLEIAGDSAVGQCMTQGQARIVHAVDDETKPGGSTLSEAALPLTVRGQVIGALRVQSRRMDAFDADRIVALQIIADQVAVALDNARLFAERQEAVQASRRAYSELSEQAWVTLLRGRRGWGYRYAQHRLASLAEASRPAEGSALMQAREQGRPVEAGEGSEPLLAVPIRVRDQVVGVFGFEKKGRSWTAEERRLLESLTEEVGSALESARLYQDVQLRAAREQLTAQVTARMRETLDVETVLKTAIREMGGMLGLPRVEVRMVEAIAPSSGEAGAQHGNGDGAEIPPVAPAGQA